ncbi:hypothetical protein GQ457_11G026710 [Hibiscus cannabinus]
MEIKDSSITHCENQSSCWGGEAIVKIYHFLPPKTAFQVVVLRYAEYTDSQATGVRNSYKVDGQDMEVTYFQAYIDGVDFVFVDSPLFCQMQNNIYGGNCVVE